MESSEFELPEEVKQPTSQKTETTPLKQVPEPNAVKGLEGWFYKLRMITRSNRQINPVNPELRELPMAERARRATLYKALKEDPSKFHEIKEESQERKKIAEQYLNQGEIKVNLPGLGEQVARYVVLKPSPEKVDQEKPKPPIFLIPGISNPIDMVGSLAQELAYLGREVVVVSFPESFGGQVTDEFAKAVEQSSTFGPHVEFFKQTIRELLGDKQDIEIWGYSTGGAIAPEILQDTEFQKRTTNAVLLAPASVTEQSMSQFQTTATLKEVWHLLTNNLKRLPFLSVDLATPDSKKVTAGLREKVISKLDLWKGARVKEGGYIVVVSGEKDDIVKSAKALEEMKQNPQIKTISIPNASHAYPTIAPDIVIPKVFQAQAEA